MIKQIIAAINRLLLLGKEPEMSQEWREQQLHEYEREQNLKAGIY